VPRRESVQVLLPDSPEVAPPADPMRDAAWLSAQGAEVVRTDRGGQVTVTG
jgi:lipoate-protein ligase B